MTDLRLSKYNRIGRIAFYTVCFAALVIFLISLGEGIPTLGGRDIDIFCSAGKAILDGENPYIVSEIGETYSWNYLPVYAYEFGYLCKYFSFAKTFLFFYIGFMLAGVAPWINKRNWFYPVTLIGTGLYSFGWGLRTGNVGVIELFAISISSYLLFGKKYNIAFLMLGLGASIKLFPLLYLPLYVIFISDWRQKKEALVWALLGFSSPFIISLILKPMLMPWYFKQLFGLIPDQHTPINEEFGFYNPSFAAFLTRIFSINLDTRAIIYFSCSIYLVFIVAYFILWKRTWSIQQNDGNQTVFYLGMVATTLLMPRLKGYSFMPALLFAYLATQKSGKWIQTIVVIVLSILPMVSNIQHESIVLTPSATISPTFINFTIQEFNQPFFLGIAFVVILYAIRLQKAPLINTN